MPDELILQPFAAMLLLTLVVWLRLYFARIPEIGRRRVDPQTLATRAGKARVELGEIEARTSDNFQNLFELPVIFYAMCLGLYVTNSVDAVYLALAWGFVLLRAAHSFIHLVYNKVAHRFIAYVLGGGLLFAMVLRFAYALVAK